MTRLVRALRVEIATVDRLHHAEALIFEYLATTEDESGRPMPATVDHLPAPLRVECSDLATAYRRPGALLTAYEDERPIGCVGLKPMPSAGTIEVKRLYVRPGHRRGGAGRLLMYRAHMHAADHGFTRVVLDVMPTRPHVIAFYQRLGYTESEQHPAQPTHPMIYMQRPISE